MDEQSFTSKLSSISVNQLYLFKTLDTILPLYGEGKTKIFLPLPIVTICDHMIVERLNVPMKIEKTRKKPTIAIKYDNGNCKSSDESSDESNDENEYAITKTNKSLTKKYFTDTIINECFCFTKIKLSFKKLKNYNNYNDIKLLRKKIIVIENKVIDTILCNAKSLNLSTKTLSFERSFNTDTEELIVRIKRENSGFYLCKVTDFDDSKLELIDLKKNTLISGTIEFEKVEIVNSVVRTFFSIICINRHIDADSDTIKLLSSKSKSKVENSNKIKLYDNSMVIPPPPPLRIQQNIQPSKNAPDQRIYFISNDMLLDKISKLKSTKLN